jgi:hypothetical protein
MLKYSVRIFVEQIFKMQRLEISSAAVLSTLDIVM